LENTESVISSDTDSAYGEKLAVAANGDAAVIWNQDNGLWSNSFTRTDGWGASAQQLDATGDKNQNPQLAIDAAGNAIALWTVATSQDNDALQAKYYHAGVGWDANPTVIQSESGKVASPHIGFDAQGNALVMWFQDGDPTGAVRWDITLNRYNVKSNSWDTAQRFATLNGGTNAATAFIKQAIDPQGNALVIWGDDSSGAYQLNANHYVAGSGWDNTITLDATAYEGDVAIDAAGNGVAVWQCNDMNLGTVCSSRYSTISGWSEAIGHYTENTVNEVVHPILASNSAGNAYVVWTELSRMAAYRFP
jgi:hypothetical protein